MYKVKSVKLKQGRQILVDGLEIEMLPIKLLEGVLKVRQASSTMILVTFYDGLKVWWDGTSRVYIDAQPEYRGKTKGLCGTFSSTRTDHGRLNDVEIPFTKNGFLCNVGIFDRK